MIAGWPIGTAGHATKQKGRLCAMPHGMRRGKRRHLSPSVSRSPQRWARKHQGGCDDCEDGMSYKRKWQPIGSGMTTRDFGRLAETLIGKLRWSQDERDAAIIALREAEKRLMAIDVERRAVEAGNTQRDRT
jgi:hypothetical protein